MAKLTFVFDDGQDVVVPVHDRRTVGRPESNDVVFDNAPISAQPAETNLHGARNIQALHLPLET